MSAAALTVFILPASAGAATQIGETFTPTAQCDAFTFLQTATPPGGPQYTMPSDGVITSWSFQSSAPGTVPPVELKIARAAGGDNFTIVGEHDGGVPAANTLTTYLVRIPVRAGDILGLRAGQSVRNCGRSAPGYRFHEFNGDPAVGATVGFTGPPENFQLDVAASLEPDCDKDGLADETQDSDVRSCPPGPTAAITGRPKDKVKTKKNRATATYTFFADDPSAIFECSLDGKEQFKPCVSPLTVTVRRGEHTFSVTATDAGGNAGATATDTFKVNRKRKRKK